MTDPINETGRVSITAGMANAMVRYGAARQCPGCKFGMPKYPGRYPTKCPRCGEELCGVKQESSEDAAPVVCSSRARRIQGIIESGSRSFEPYMGDAECSRAVTVRYSALSEHGGVDGFRAFLEGPVEGYYYRVESLTDPLLIFEFDDTRGKMRVFASAAPDRYLTFDPRGGLVDEDHDATFEDANLDEGFLSNVAAKAVALLKRRMAKLLRYRTQFQNALSIAKDAEREAGAKFSSPTLRMAKSLAPSVRPAFSGVSEAVEEVLDIEPVDESLTAFSILGIALAVLGGVPMLLKAMAKAAKWIGYKRAADVLGRFAHVAHSIEAATVDWSIPDELSYAVYKLGWRAGWGFSHAIGNAGVDRDDPVEFGAYLVYDKLRAEVEMTMWRIMLIAFFVNGIVALLHAPLSALFAVEAAATSVKAAEIGQGVQRAATVMQRIQASVDPSRVRMVDIGSNGLMEAISLEDAGGLLLFLSEDDAAQAAQRVNLPLAPSKRIIGEDQMWVLFHEGTGLALARGEVKRLEEYFGSGPGAPSYNAVTYGPERTRARQRAVDRTHDRVAGAFAEDQRSSAARRRKTGEGPTQVRGGIRIHVGKNSERKPRKDVQQVLQNRLNQRRGLRARIQGAKKWHRSREGKKMHRDLARYNASRTEADDATLRYKIMDVKDRIARYSAGQTRQPGLFPVFENAGVMGSYPGGQNTRNASSADPSQIENPTPDDKLESILRKLIVTQNMDVLQDVEFDERAGSIYLFFDPVLMPDEVQEMLSAIQQAESETQLIASPDMSLPGETVESEWWVLFLPGPREGMPDPSIYAQAPEQYSTKVQTVVMAPPDQPEALAQDVDVTQMLKSAGN